MGVSSSPARREAPSLTRLSRAQGKLLEKVAAAGRGGIARAASAEASELMARGLAETAGDRLVATSAGRAWAARNAGGGFLAQHRALGRRSVEIDGALTEALVDLDESPLAWLARRKGRDGRPLLQVHEIAAGERLRADFTRGQMSPRVTANWELSASRGRKGGAGVGVDLADSAVAARTRVARALAAVGPELSGALVDVCCFLKGLEEVERDRGWPARGAKVVLGIALSSLARHYGYAGEAAPEDGPRRIVSWGTPDSRPKIDGEPEPS